MVETKTTEVKKVASISMKNLGYTAKAIRTYVDGKGSEKLFLARIGGVVIESFGGTSKHGEWDAFRGIFTLVNKDNEAVSSGVVFLPANITKKIKDLLANGQVEISFMVDIFVTETDKNASGYAYMVEQVASDGAEKQAQTIADRVLSSKLPNQTLLAAPKKKTA